MTISFSGLASGLDTSSWVEALVSVKKQEVTALETKLKGYQTKVFKVKSNRIVFSKLFPRPQERESFKSSPLPEKAQGLFT